MKAIRFIRRGTELEEIKAALQGKVFHVTALEHLPDILRTRVIVPNREGMLPSTFGYVQNGFFRKRNCVSLFDYRPEPSEEVESFRMRCSPFQAALKGPAAILILKPEVLGSLIPWTRWSEEQALSEMIVPHVEAGHEGPIGIELVEEIICLAMTEGQNSLAAIVSGCPRPEWDGGIIRGMAIQISGFYLDGLGTGHTIVQEGVRRSGDDQFIIRVRLHSQSAPDCRSGQAHVSDGTWIGCGQSDEARCNSVGEALVLWIASNQTPIDFDIRSHLTTESSGPPVVFGPVKPEAGTK